MPAANTTTVATCAVLTVSHVEELTNEGRLQIARHGFAEDLQAGDILLADSGRMRGIVRWVKPLPRNSREISRGRSSEAMHNLETVRYIRGARL